MTFIDLKPYKTIRLAVSGDVSLNRLETSLLDTTDFQRLRQICQLGPCHLVYPTALHTRFDHSLGTLSMARMMHDAIEPAEGVQVTQEHVQLTRLFALLHDVFHVPFGHTLEDEFCIFPRHDKHLDRIERFAGAESSIGGKIVESLGSELHQRLMRLFQGKERVLAQDGFILDLVTNSVCADLLDYLQRDSFFCNISMDSDYRFLRHLTVVQHAGQTRLAIRLWKEGKSTPRRDVLNELIRLLDNRYLMSERVYFHHAKIVAGTMIAAAVSRAIASGELREDELYHLGDDTLLYRLSQCGEPNVRRLTDGITCRTLWKRIYERGRALVMAEQHASRTVNVMQDLMKRFHTDPAQRMNAESRLAGLMNMPDGDLLIYCPNERMSMKMADCMVFWNGELRPLKDCTDDELVGAKLKSILDSHQNLWSLKVFMNPRYLARADQAADALDNLLTYDESRQKRSSRAFYKEVVRQALQHQTFATTHDQEQTLEEAMNFVLSLEENNRTSEVIQEWMRKKSGG